MFKPTKEDKPIIQQRTDIDLYTFPMQQTILHHCPTAIGRKRFKCRNEGVALGRFAAEISAEVDSLCTLEFTEPELAFLAKGRPWLTPDFIEFQRLFRLNRNYINVENHHGELFIESHGPMVHTMPFELYVLPIVQEVYTRNTYPDMDYREGERRLTAKIEAVKAYHREFQRENGGSATCPLFQFVDFGGRRRFNRRWHKHVVGRLRKELSENFTGTSNVWLAMEHDLTAIGTMAHEILQLFQALTRLADFQKVALNTWAEEFRGDLGIALTDVVGMDAFCRDLDLFLAKLFDGFRHDSGDPFLWTEKLIKRLTELRLDPFSKKAVYSDSLTMELAFRLHRAFCRRVRPFFGIGTHLTNDLGVTPLNNVMKLIGVQATPRSAERPVAKLPDSNGKQMCTDDGYLAYLATATNLTHYTTTEV